MVVEPASQRWPAERGQRLLSRVRSDGSSFPGTAWAEFDVTRVLIACLHAYLSTGCPIAAMNRSFSATNRPERARHEWIRFRQRFLDKPSIAARSVPARGNAAFPLAAHAGNQAKSRTLRLPRPLHSSAFRASHWLSCNNRIGGRTPVAFQRSPRVSAWEEADADLIRGCRFDRKRRVR
jgi:hypothetical protein